MYFNLATQLATVIGVLIGLFAFLIAVNEYRRQGIQARVKYFLSLRRKLKGSKRFRKILDLVEDNSPELASVPYEDRRDLLGLFEEVALMVNTNLVRADVAHYMFGYYAIRCWESSNFWDGINRDSIYWSLFREFVSKMERFEKLTHKRKGKLRL